MTAPFRVVVLDDYLGVAAGAVDWTSSRHRIDVRILNEHVSSEAALRDMLADASAIVAMRERTPLRATLLRELPRLRLIVTAGTRNDSIEPVDGVTICGTRMLATPTAELTWGLILAVTRKIVAEDRALRAGRWHTEVGDDLAGRTLGLLGLGRLGQQVARVGSAFGMNLIAWSHNLTPERAAEVGVRAVDADELFGTSDVLSIHLRLSDRTRQLVDERRLSQMKATAVLVNTSRAGIVDHAALVAALHDERLAGAGIDVYDIEPLPLDDPIRSAPRTVLTPHLGYAVRRNYELIYRDAFEQIKHYLDGPAEPSRESGDGQTATERQK